MLLGKVILETLNIVPSMTVVMQADSVEKLNQRMIENLIQLFEKYVGKTYTHFL